MAFDRPLARPARRRPLKALRFTICAHSREALLGWLDDAADPRRPALDWLARCGEARGFEIDREATRVAAYRRVSLSHRGTQPAVFGQVDFEGVLTVCDGEAFGAALAEGFGRAKAFGCGLMLRARERSS
jgi:CRISPR-associated protein Cas6/Cse3/CasE subtype I-E